MLKDYKAVDLILYLDRPSQAVCYQPLRKRIALLRTETAEDGFEPSIFRTYTDALTAEPLGKQWITLYRNQFSTKFIHCEINVHACLYFLI